MPKIAIIGAGIPGVFSAYKLALHGYDVTVFDRERYAAMETSFANGSQLSACNAEVWNKMATVVQGTRWMLRPDAPLLINTKPSWQKLSWMAELIRNIPHYERNTIDTVREAIAARQHIFDAVDAENIDRDLAHKGILHFYRDQAAFEDAKRANDIMVKGGLDRYAVTLDEMRAIEPALTGTFYGGFFSPTDSTGDAHKFSIALAAACARRGVRFHYETTVDEIAPRRPQGYSVHWRPVNDKKAGADTSDFDAVVICAGVASPAFARRLGDRINIYPVKGYSITVELDAQASREAAPTVGLLDSAAEIVASRLGEGRYRVAGTAEFNGFNRDIRADRIKPLVDWVNRRFPGVDTQHAVPWAGLRPMTPEMMPHVGAGKRPGVFYNTGHGNHGWTLSGATAARLAQAVMQQIPA